ncbi:hypothetical protein [Okeania sp.]|uniref:hypothetical protein n=1 Tax=Okeania sp. TaxID=3100323 RepID=UPI002B4B8A88|nr:hypothetical protein [Okeania sp.]MEB3339367.1 hypothetical protein [Okeania sp.]
MMTKFSLLIKNFALTLVIGLASISLLITNASTAFAGTFLFYEGNNCTQDIIAYYDSNEVYVQDNCKETRRCENDETRSLLIKGPVEISQVGVYDDPNGDNDDDYSIIYINSLGPNEQYCVNTYEKNQDNSQVIVNYQRHNGLDGKVSLITILN